MASPVTGHSGAAQSLKRTESGGHRVNILRASPGSASSDAAVMLSSSCSFCHKHHTYMVCQGGYWGTRRTCVGANLQTGRTLSGTSHI